ncbi:MAG: ABC transporter substrate-binding protein [Clostridiales Family XIII bacterium]|jgi:peptide/nickel transport system substrate-binding protein|nr:ABC transporter substrate-binding protein [Clostridiales Family XIII bacterium]
MKLQKKIVLILAVALAVLSITACSGSGSGSETAETSDGAQESTEATEGEDTEEPVELVVAVNGEPRSLDPAFNYEYAAYHVVNHISEALLTFDQTGQLGPGLAESWEAVDATTYVYQIRQGVKFSDGSDLTVEDVIFSLERLRDPALASDVNWMFANVDTIEQTNDWEVTVKLTQPDATWQYVPATPGGQIVSKAYVEEKGESFGKNDGGTLGAGAYKLESWTPGSQIILTRNEYYWNQEDAGAIDKITVNIIPDSSAIQLALESGQADLTISSSKAVSDAFIDSSSINIISTPSIGNFVFSFNTQKAPFDDVNVRKAIAHAIDNVGIRESQYGVYALDTTVLPFGEAGYTPGTAESWIEFAGKLPDYAYNIDKAKEYLAKSGHPDGFTTSLYYKPNPIANSAAQAIAASLKQIGIELELKQLQLSEYYAYAYGGQITDGIRDYDLGLNDWLPDFPDPVGHLLPQYSSTTTGAGGSNFAAYSNPEVDKLIDAQNATTDPEERSKLLKEAFAIAAEDVPYKYLAYPNNTLLLNKKFEYELGTIWIFNFNYKDIKVVG